MYQNIDTALVRAAAGPDAKELPALPDVDEQAPGAVDAWRQWLEDVWSHQAVAEAVEVASPVLANRISAICSGPARRPRQVRKAAASLARYLLRVQHRATPFGLFAGVAATSFGPRLELSWGEKHHVSARPDAVWLADVITRLEGCPELLRRLPVVADQTCVVRDGALTIPHRQQHYAQDAPGRAASVSLAYTKAVDMVLRSAQSPVVVGDLADALAIRYPDTPMHAIDGLLDKLVGQRVLISSLRAPMTVFDALGHLVDQLAAARADDLPSLTPVVQQLRELRNEVGRHDGAAPEARRESRAAISARMAAMSTVGTQPLAVDLGLDCSLTLPQEVAREAERAATVLAHLTPLPSGYAAWQEYHARFLERYGIGAHVPVRELIDPDTGLGFPAGYRGSLLQQSTPALTARDEQLLEMAQRAALDGTDEIVLDDETITALSSSPSQVPAHAQMSFRLHAPTRTALESGAFELVVVGLTAGAGNTVGRFLSLLDPADLDHFTEAYAALPTRDPGALPAQISSPPLRARTENVARAPLTLPYLISLAEHDTSNRALPLHDLAVGAHAERMYLVSLSQGRTVEPTLLNAVNLPNYTHPLARFLHEVHRARTAVLAPFSWGAARHLPFLPRIRYGRTVLAPARWRLTRADLGGPKAPWPDWTDSVAAWRNRSPLPHSVFLGDDDQRLRLSLDNQAHLRLLRAHLERQDHATLHEAPDPTAYGWFGGRAHEITMALATAPKPTPRPARRSAPITVARDDGHLPGTSPWAYAKLYGHPDRVPDILTRHLPDLLTGWDALVEWWFVRYSDPDPHLRLRFLLPHEDAYGEAVRRVGTWAAGLRASGLLGRATWDTYYPETGRYGSGAAMAAAETAFAADSRAAIAQLKLTAGTGLHPAVTAASTIDLVTTLTGNTAAAMRWLTNTIGKPSGPAPARQVHNEAMRLADPHRDFAALRALPGGEETVGAWIERRQALTAYSNHLTGEKGPAQDSVLNSLLHMHHIRTAGIHPTCERDCRRLARAAALSWLARQGEDGR